MAGSIAFLVEISVVLLAVGMVVVIVLHIQLKKKLRHFMAGGSGASLEESLGTLIEKIQHIEHILESHKEGLEVLDHRVKKSIRAYSLVRYNAFANEGGTQSFASGLLDEEKNGYVLSVITHRNHVGVYARPIKNGVPESGLTVEETHALTQAISQL